jgi:hypothetical protein
MKEVTMAVVGSWRREQANTGVHIVIVTRVYKKMEVA